MRVDEKDVDDLVRALLNDPAINIPLIPDAIEAQLYKSTIQLTINAVFWLVARLHGVRILSHEIDLTLERGSSWGRRRNTNSPPRTTMAQALADGAAKHVNDEVLREVADRLLENPAVNSSWIPDSIEHQIYTSCLLVVFRVLQVVLASFRICLCGHTVTLNLSGNPEYSLEQRALNVVKGSTSPREKSFSSIDLDILRKKAREAGVDDQTNRDWFWNRIFTRSTFVEELHMTLYGLILSVLDDVFDDELKVHILSDAIQLDLVPAMPKDDGKDKTKTKQEATEVDDGAGSFAVASFAAGMGVGMSLMAMLTQSKD